MHQPIKRYAAAMLVSALLAGACTSRPAAPSSSRSMADTAPPTFTITSAPAVDATLEDGHFYIAGQLNAEAGLAPIGALLFRVVDRDTALSSELNLKELVDNWAADEEEFEGATAFNPETGEFVIDGNADMVIDAGDKNLQLVGKDSLGRVAMWTRNVSSEGYASPSLAEIGESRAAFLTRLRDAVSDYQDYVSSLTCASPIDAKQLDLDFIDALISYLDARISDPTCAHASGSGDSFESAVSGIIATYGVPEGDPIETNYRPGTINSAGQESFAAGLAQQEAVEFQLQIHPDLAGMHAVGELEKAFYDHTFISTEVVGGAGPTIGTFKFRIYQDEGTPNPRFDLPLTWDPESLVPETADPDSPGLYLAVRFYDTNSSDPVPVVRAIEQSGYNLVPGTGQVEFADSASYNHLVQPLTNLWLSDYSMFNAP